MSKIAELYYRAAGAMNYKDSLNLNDGELNNSKELIAKANAITIRLMDIYSDNMNYYLSLKGTKFYKLLDTDMNQALYIMQATVGTLRQTNQKELSAKYEKIFMDLASRSGM
jgi:hypothetical protein